MRLLAAGAALAAAACAPGPRPNLLVVTLDTTRADRLGCYGCAAARTPTLDRLAAEGTLFESCLSAVPITTPSHSTIFTGTYPQAHGVRDNGRFRLPPAAVTLAEVLKGQGYVTGAAVGAFPLTREWGVDQGFDLYDDHVTVGQEDERGNRVPARRMFFEERSAVRVNEAILPWLRENARRPFFAWVHYWDPHQPYLPPPPFSELFAHDLYQGEIAYVDRALGVLLAELERQGVAGRTVVAVVGDHGEGLGEHGEETHSMLLYDATLRVPLVIRVPGQPGGRRVRERVGTVDLMPTLLELLGVEPPAEVSGRSLVKAMSGRAGGGDEGGTYYAETLSPRLSYGWGELRAVYSGQHKYIHGPRQELFALDRDPGELVNLAPGGGADRLRAELVGLVGRHARPTARAAVVEVDADTRDRLAALGYLSGEGDDAGWVEEALTSAGDPPQQHIANVSRWSACKQALELGDSLRGRDLALELVASEPGNPFYRSLLVVALSGLGRLDQAAAVAEEGPVTAQNDAVYLQLAQALFSAGARPRAEALARRVVGQRPSADAHYLLGEMRAALGDPEQHESELRAALVADPGHLRARRSLAVRLAESGRGPEAEAELRRLVAQTPLDPAAHLNLATLLLKEGRYGEAAGPLDRALELDPGYCRAHLAMVAMYVALDEPDRARAARAALEQRCADPETRRHAVELVGGQ